MTFMEVFQNIWVQVFGLFERDLNFPEPIGLMSPLDLMMFFSIAYMLADAVSMVASRRD